MLLHCNAVSVCACAAVVSLSVRVCAAAVPLCVPACTVVW